jgi:hypothetical protein
MPRVGFKSTTPVFERAKRFHALDGAATVSGLYIYLFDKKIHSYGIIMSMSVVGLRSHPTDIGPIHVFSSKYVWALYP